MNDIKARLIATSVDDLGIVRLEFETTSQLVSGLVTKGNDLFLLRKIEEVPETEESDDERILSGIIGIIDHGQSYGVSKAEMLEYLNGLQKKSKLIPGFYFVDPNGKRYFSRQFRCGELVLKVKSE